MATTGPETSSESDGSAGPVDETRHRRLTTRLGRDRFPRGQRAIIDVAARWDGTTLLGALSEGETRVHRCERSVTPEATIRFLRSLAEAFGDELIAVREIVPYFTSKKVGQFSECAAVRCNRAPLSVDPRVLQPLNLPVVFNYLYPTVLVLDVRVSLSTPGGRATTSIRTKPLSDHASSNRTGDRSDASPPESGLGHRSPSPGSESPLRTRRSSSPRTGSATRGFAGYFHGEMAPIFDVNRDETLLVC